MQQVLILVLIAVMLLTASVLWFGYFNKGPGSPVSVVKPEGAAEGIEGSVPQQVEINFDVLLLPILQDLKDPALPVLEPALKGRNNPFLPF
ncbi:MAG: hypothetical protein A3C82_00735 [Candidatus Wildermuthbacteria bacterium RIFCSPHIGHO2_02_FULL_47_12]|uniref:Uncharacterized protein n=2 Tax=Parcubacteria group TaxID=1794811 RepID=A0A1G2R2G8_9BACT|nr:MAG: hypothetical protein A3A24_01160 [Candidatus Buchananbacteria bacterium RIFCSPLOWO2_01_FULL_46_12]OHA66778.1 MAG: hypothetical protein A3C82_00735 [Candidatus Wildermuthbacteria bacterium RIFCSPHIGHO2_02_FULL_47_12]